MRSHTHDGHARAFTPPVHACCSQGAFVKFSSNSGFVSDEAVRNTPHAFSHFTFEQSGGEELVVDIQV